jgi:hypothetical protein
MEDLTSKHRACRTHCCIIHGCKYGHDDCPVVLGFVKQEYLCESCTFYSVFSDDELWTKVNTRFLKLNRKLKLDGLKG